MDGITAGSGVATGICSAGTCCLTSSIACWTSSGNFVFD